MERVKQQRDLATLVAESAKVENSSMRFSFPAQASSVNITIAPRPEAAAPGMPPYLLPLAPRVIQQPPQQQGGRGRVDRTICRGCWGPLKGHARTAQHQRCLGNCIACDRPVQGHRKDTMGGGELMTGQNCSWPEPEGPNR